jgi:hypothetical protein
VAFAAQPLPAALHPNLGKMIRTDGIFSNLIIHNFLFLSANVLAISTA